MAGMALKYFPTISKYFTRRFSEKTVNPYNGLNLKKDFIVIETPYINAAG